MPTKAYLVTSSARQRKLFLCGLDENDLEMRLRLEYEYKNADVVFMVSNAVDLASHYFHTTPHKLSAAIRTVDDIPSLLQAVNNTSWSVLCLLKARELEILRFGFSDWGKISAVDFNAYDANFDDDETYYERFPHVHMAGSRYMGIFSLSGAAAESVETAQAHASNDYSNVYIEATNEMLMDEDRSESYIVAAVPEECQLIPYVPPVFDVVETLANLHLSRR